MRPSQELADALGPVHPAARAMALEMDLAENAEYITEHLMRIVFPERGEDDAFRELLRHNAYDNLDVMWRIIASRDDLAANPPFGAIAFSDTAAHIGVPLSQFVRIYRVGAGLVWSLWYRAAQEYSRAHEVDPWDLLGGPSMIVHSYIDGQISTLLARYENAQAEHARTREQLQVSVLRQLLDGNAALGEPEIEQALGVRLDGSHVAIAIQTDRDPVEIGVVAALLQAIPGSHPQPHHPGRGLGRRAPHQTPHRGPGRAAATPHAGAPRRPLAVRGMNRVAGTRPHKPAPVCRC